MLSCCCWVEGRVRPPRKKHERGEYTGIGSDFVMEKKGLATLKDRSEASYTKISLQSLYLPNIRSELEAESHQRAIREPNLPIHRLHSSVQPKIHVSFRRRISSVKQSVKEESA